VTAVEDYDCRRQNQSPVGTKPGQQLAKTIIGGLAGGAVQTAGTGIVELNASLLCFYRRHG
jgi:hypothetical protein